MAASSVVKVIACSIAVCMVVFAPRAEATLSCGQVTATVGKCIPYLKGGPGPSSACCSGLRSLVDMTATPTDKKTACSCLKTAASSSGINYSLASGLPNKCGVRVSYKFSPSIDCSKVK